MTRRFLVLGLLVAVFATFTAIPADATTVLQLNLDDLSERADKIYRGTVVSITPTTIQTGGSDLPAVTYRLRVEESFKGTFQEEKGVQYADLTMIGNVKDPGSGSVVNVMSIAGLPRLQMGHDYVLMTTPESAIGLATTVGLSQGCFEIVPGAKAEENAVNGTNNQGLGFTTDGPVSYDTLAAAIRSRVSE